MGTAIRPKGRFGSREAAEFKLQVLAGCRRLSVDELRELADEIHECARRLRHSDPHARRFEDTGRSFSPHTDRM